MSLDLVNSPSGNAGASHTHWNGFQPGAGGAERARSYLCFRQDGLPYLLAEDRLVAIVGVEHVQRLANPVEGWMGTLTMQGGIIPVLDAGALLHPAERGPSQHGPTAVLLLRLPSGPLGLAVERLEGINPISDPWMTDTTGPGLRGSLVTGGQIALILDPVHLDTLRQVAVAPSETGRRSPQPVHWLAAHPDSQLDDEPPAPAGDDGGATIAVRVGLPVVILSEHFANERDPEAPRCALALPVNCIVAVGRPGALRVAPPAMRGMVGFQAWGVRALPVVDPVLMGLARASTSTLGYAVVLNPGITLLTGRVRGVQGVIRMEEPLTDGGVVSAFGETRGRRAGEQMSIGIVGQHGEGASYGTRVAVVDPFRLAALLAHPPGVRTFVAA